ncbi:double-CXXCG motif protein [Bacillus pseudomycoides]|uniref:double-CXXCG motif protein n=1 Tax=Bacillus pseudomycoides TaxID=64104 RepID=UPI002E215414|nr:double-CXXCG motif protein [Bacillus pseudomycoides]
MTFYIMRETYANFAEPIEGVNKFAKESCDTCGGILRIKQHPLRIYFQGNRMADFYTTPSYKFISDKMQKALLDNNITGFSLEPFILEEEAIPFMKLPLEHVKTLKELDVHGDGGYICHSNGEQIKKCQHCGKILENKRTIEGLSVNTKEWDGSDIFFFKNWPRVIIVTEKVKEIVEKHKFKNIRFIDLADFRFA